LDFLLECIGFPPDCSMEEIVSRVLRDGEPAAWRGEPDRHRRLALGGGLEIRIDKEHGREHWSVLPHYQVPHRLRVAVDEIRTPPDSPFDALILGWAAPPIEPEEARLQPGAYRMSAFVTDARRLPRKLPFGHVLALSIAGFALDVSYVGPDRGPLGGSLEGSILDGDGGARIMPLGSPDDPGGCAEVSLRIERILHLENPITGIPIEVLEVEAPERPLQLFVSRWQLEKDALPQPRPGWRVEGTFLFSGRIAGGLPGPRKEVAASFG
jgi:hypothetical protein